MRFPKPRALSIQCAPPKGLNDILPGRNEICGIKLRKLKHFPLFFLKIIVKQSLHITAVDWMLFVSFESGKVKVEGTWFFFTNFLCESGLTMESMSTNFNDFFFYIFV